MKALLVSFGTRGDIEPFLAVGEVLRERGWEVVCLFPEQFRDEVEAIGYRFHGFDPAFLELLRDADGQRIIGGGGSLLSRVKSWIALARKGMRLNRESGELQQRVLADESPDLLLYHPKSLFNIIWAMANPGKAVLVSPLPGVAHPLSDFGPVFKDHGRLLNRLEHWIVNNIKAATARSFARKYPETYSEVDTSLSAIRNAFVRDQPAVYLISPSLFDRPAAWPENAKIVGYFERDKTADWTPPAELQEFLEKYQRPILISFGSMTNPEPEKKTRIFVNVLTKLGIPAIINTSWGGLQRLENAPEHILFVDSIPYDWAFPRVYAVVHHGGSGTTHMAAKYGCPSLIIPHAVDQFMWARIVEKKGLGPKAIPIKRISEEKLANALEELYNVGHYKTAALVVAERMLHEPDPHRLFSVLTDGVEAIDR
ncbi:MAG: glycosyltransferase family 1 protein [Acidobacteria bacterium]|nr:glycosyltransferase family 1 protein [Acidobacteriota bacterium]